MTPRVGVSLCHRGVAFHRAREDGLAVLEVDPHYLVHIRRSPADTRRPGPVPADPGPGHVTVRRCR